MELSTALCRAVFEQAAVGVSIAGLDGRIHYVNSALCQLTGFSKDSLIGRACGDLSEESALDEMSTLLEVLQSGQSTYNMEKRYRHQQGREVWVHLAISLLRDAEGKPEFLLNIATDITERVQAEKEQQLLRAQLQRSQYLAQTGAWELEIETNHLFWTEETYRIFEISPDEFASTYEAFLHTVHPDDTEVVDAAYQYSIENKVPYDITHRLQFPDGRIKWVREIGETVYDDDGCARRTLGAVQDVTEQYKAAETLRSSSQVINAVLDTTPVMIAYLDPDMNFVRVNQTYAAADGKTPDFFIGKNHFALFPNAENEVIFRRVAETGVAYTAKAKPFEYEHNPERGVSHWDWTLTPIKDTQGSVTGVVLSLLDVTERVKAVEAAQLSEKALLEVNNLLEQRVAERTAELAAREYELRQAQEIARIGHWTANLQTNELDWSDEAIRIFGQDPATYKPTSESFYAAVHPQDVPLLQAAQEHAASKGVPFSLDHRIILPDGSLRWVHEEARLELDSQGQPLALIGTTQDITERKRNEEALENARDVAERASRAKSEFLSRMSHELRTPMNAILGFAQVLNLERLSAEQFDYTNEILQAGGHLLALIEELLDMSRIESGKMHTVMQPVVVKRITDEAVQLNQSLLATREITLINKCATDAIALSDALRLRQILVNLISNAAKYNRQGGRIVLECVLQPDGMLRLQVTDTGYGIPEERRADLFKPFERLGAEKTEVEGVGIGLALSKQLADLLGCRLGVVSTPGIGSTFWLDLPCAPLLDHEIQSSELTDHQATADATLRVLYIEDNPANLRVVEAIFRHHTGMRLLSANNGEYGLELAQRYLPEVILLDIHLPGMDGYEVLRQLQSNESTRNIPVLAVSADAMPLDIERATAAGFRSYLTKPIQIEALMQSIREVAPKTIEQPA